MVPPHFAALTAVLSLSYAGFRGDTGDLGSVTANQPAVISSVLMWLSTPRANVVGPVLGCLPVPTTTRGVLPVDFLDQFPSTERIAVQYREAFAALKPTAAADVGLVFVARCWRGLRVHQRYFLSASAISARW